MKLSERDRKVLETLARGRDEYFYPFAFIMRKTGLDRKQVRNACRSMRRKGLTQFQAGLWDEYDGTPAGAGYAITPAGRLALQPKQEDRR